MESRVCKKCNRPLPEGYKYKNCESCRGHFIEKVKNIGAAVGSVVVVVGSIAVTIANALDKKDD